MQCITGFLWGAAAPCCTGETGALFWKKRHPWCVKPTIPNGLSRWETGPGIWRVERNAVRDAVRAAGAGRVVLMENALAAAIGGGVDVCSTKGQIVMDIGGGKTEISAISDGRVLATVTSDVSGSRFDEDIVSYVRKNYNILIGNSTAEQVKKKIGTVCEMLRMDFITLSGRDLLQGLPVSFVLSSEDIRNALRDSVHVLTDSLVALLEKLPPVIARLREISPYWKN